MDSRAKSPLCARGAQTVKASEDGMAMKEIRVRQGYLDVLPLPMR
jgi:hypothetical protein